MRAGVVSFNVGANVEFIPIVSSADKTDSDIDKAAWPFFLLFLLFFFFFFPPLFLFIGAPRCKAALYYKKITGRH